MHIVWTILIGFVVGLVAKLLTPGPGPGGFFLTAPSASQGLSSPRISGKSSAGIKSDNRQVSLVGWSEPSSFWWAITFFPNRVLIDSRLNGHHGI